MISYFIGTVFFLFIHSKPLCGSNKNIKNKYNNSTFVSNCRFTECNSKEISNINISPIATRVNSCKLLKKCGRWRCVDSVNMDCTCRDGRAGIRSSTARIRRGTSGRGRGTSAAAYSSSTGPACSCALASPGGQTFSSSLKRLPGSVKATKDRQTLIC